MVKHKAFAGTTLGKGDQIALLALLAFSVIVAAGALLSAIQRVVEVIGGHGVWVHLEFAEAPISVPLAENEPPIGMTMDAASLQINNPSAATSAWLVSSAVLGALATVTIIVTLMLLARSALRGPVFSRRNTTLVTIAGTVFMFQVLLLPNVETFGTNQALSELLANTKPNEAMAPVIGTFALGPVLLAALVSGLVAGVFQIGERMQRDTDGLV